MEVRVLGPVEASTAGEALALGGPRQRRLLLALVLGDGRLVGMDRIVEAVWGGEEPPAGAVRTAFTYVSRLRAALGDGYVSTSQRGYVLGRDDLVVDADRFEALVTEARDAAPARALVLLDDALGLWRGNAFGDFADEMWCRPAAARLEALRLFALEARSQARLDVGAHGELVAEVERLVVEHPLRDRFRAQLMIALYRSGRQAEALRSFQDYRRMLSDETGLDPSRELVELERRIALADPTLLFVTAGRTARGYVLADVIGEGAFGTVYRAVQPSVGREVAVKVVRPELADDPDYVRRFEGEARLVARLEHPHIVPLYDFWREPGAAYLVFRYLRGGSLLVNGVGEQWSVARASRLVEEIGSALAVAHETGVVHGDVKPVNVLFDALDNSYLADFGIATDALDPQGIDGRRSARSQRYASPEQVQDGVATPRSDQYAFAVMVWELLAGVVAVSGDRGTAVVRARVANDLPSLRERRPDVPGALDTVLSRAGAVHPDNRYASMGDFLLAWHTAAGRLASASSVTDAPAAVVASATSAARTVRVVNPYKGLRPFDEADARDLHGRDDALEQLTRLVCACRFVTVVGASGSGKSSLVRAGLVPRVRAESYLVAVAVPGAQPADAIAEALLSIAIDPPPRLADQVLTAAALPAALARMLPGGDADLILVLDQFEELWTLVDASTRQRLLRALVASCEAPASRLRVVATVRADFYDRPLSDPVIGSLVKAGAFSLAPLSAAELGQVIAGPAARLGIGVEPSLVAELVDDMTRQPAALPLLQYALTELFDQRAGATMTLASYRKIGGLSGALVQRAEAIHHSLADGDHDGERRLFSRLVAPGEGTQDTRRRARRSELVMIPTSLIDAFGAARLLAFDVDPRDRDPTVEVAHEALIRHWPRLRAWLDEDRDGLRIHRHLADSAAGWHRRGRERADLYQGTRLVAAQEWATAHPDDLDPDGAAFLRESSLRARRAGQARALARTALAIATVFALVAAVIAVRQRQRADRNAITATASAATARTEKQRSDLRRLAFQAQAVAPAQPQLGLLLAEEAYRRNPNVESEGALLSALDDLRTIARFTSVTDAAVAGYADESPDGRFLAVVSGTEAVIVDGMSLRPTGVRLDLPSSTVTLRFSTDGTEIAVGGEDGNVRRYDVESGQATAPPVTVAPGKTQGSGVPLAYLRGGRLAAGDGHVVIVFARGSTTSQRVMTLPLPVSELDANPTGRWLAAADPSLVAKVYDDDTGVARDLPPGLFSFGFDDQRHRLLAGSLVGGLGVSSIDVATATVVRTVTVAEIAYRWAVLPDGSSLAATGDGSTLHFAADLTPLSTLVDPHFSNPLVLADGRVVTVAAHGFGQIDLTARGRLATTLPVQGRATISADGRDLVTLGGGGVHLTDPTSGRQRLIPHALAPNPGGPLSDLAVLSGDRRYVAVLAVAPPHLQLFDVASGRSILDVPTSGVNVSGPAFSPDNRALAVPGLSQLDVYDLASGTPTMTYRYTSTLGAAVSWSPDGQRLLVQPLDADSKVIDRTGKELFTIDGRSRGAWSPDGTTLAIVSLEHDLRLFDARSGHLIDELTGIGLSGAISFTSDGKRIIKYDIDGAIELIDLRTRSLVGRRIVVAGGRIADGADPVVAPDGRTIYITQLTGGAVAYDLDPESWAVKACDSAGRNLTRLEWTTYLASLDDYRPTCAQYPSG